MFSQSMSRKGILMAGGNGNRLKPITISVSKQLMPVYDKPMIFYPLTTLMLAGIREILVITNTHNLNAFKNLLSDGSKWGISIKYMIQEKPNGIAEAFILGEEFINNSTSALILGDNLFHSSGLVSLLKEADKKEDGATIFSYRVNDPENYGVIKSDKEGKLLDIIEKPNKYVSNDAVTGLYFYDKTVVQKAKEIVPSKRNELEITSINQMYLRENKLSFYRFNRGSAWLDTGNFDSLHRAGSYIRTLESRTGLKIGCPEEVAWIKGWISSEDVILLSKEYKDSGYGDYLRNLISEK